MIATPYKCGTTWMQGIVSCLVLGECRQGASVWLDFRPESLDDTRKKLSEQTHRRFIKTHLPLDGLPYHENIKYIVVSRDVRDVFMSLWNHYGSYTDAANEKFNNWPGRVGPPQPVCPTGIHDFWKMWISRGWFEWESEGYPFWSNMRHVQTWWDQRHLANLLFVHYNHLKSDPHGQVRRIAKFLDIEITDERIDETVDATTIDSMREAAIKREEGQEGLGMFENGATTFFYKGTNDRWKDVLTEEDLLLYEAAADRNLSNSCRRWLETGEE